MAFEMTRREANLQGVAKWIRAAWTPTILVYVVLYGGLLQYLVLGLPGIGYDKHIEAIPVGWRSLSAHIVETANSYGKDTGSEPLIVGMDRYAIASELAFYGGRRNPSALETANSHLFGGMSLMYGQWMPAEAQEGRNLLLVAWTPGELDDLNIAARVERLGPIEDDVLMRDGILIRHYYHRLAFNYHSRPGE